MWTCFLNLRVYPRLLWNLSEKLCFEPSQIATVPNCDNSGITAVAICDLSQFVIKAVTAQTESNNTENVFWVLGTVPMFTFDMNMKSCIFTHFGVISLVNLFMCTVYPKKYAHGSCFAVLCCGYTLTDFPISIRLTSLALWQSNNCPSASKATLMNMDKYFMWIHYERLHNHNKAKHNKTVCIFLGIYCMFISYKAHNRCTQEAFLKGSDFDVNMFSALRSIPSVTMKSIWEVVFWTITNCDSHKLRQFRNPCRRNLWFVANCDQGRDGTNWVQ